MYPPVYPAPPASNQSMAPPPNELAQQFQDMKLGQPQGHRMQMNFSPTQNQYQSPRSQIMNNPANSNLPRLPRNQSPAVFSPQHHGSTTVTYSGPPRATYPYNNNPSINVNSNTPPTNTTQFNLKANQNLQNTNSAGRDLLSNSVSTHFQSALGLRQQNGMSNGHIDSKPSKDSSIFSPAQPNPSQVSPSHQPMQYQHASHMKSPLQQSSPFPMPNSAMTTHPNPALNNMPLPPPSSNMAVHQSPVQNSQMGMYSNQAINSMPPPPSPSNISTAQVQQAAFQGSLAHPPPMGFTPSPTHSVSSPHYSGMSSSPPNSGGMWPSSPRQPFPAAGNVQAPGSYPYSPQNQGLPPQQSPTIDLDQMPSNVQVREDDKKVRGGYYVHDVKEGPPPLVSTNFIFQDRGICNPRFIRSTTYCLPNQPDLLKQTGIPFVLTISPFASLNEGEAAPALCLYREEGPLRCKRCKAYICSFMTFMEGGRCFQCAFCKVVTEVPQDYFCFLDGMGERTDKYHRPELCLGSYEYMATKEYCRNDQIPNPPAYIFMIEVSNAAYRNGLVPLLCENMKNVLQCLKNDEQNDTSKLRIGFVTYNNVLHFYNMKKNLTQPHIMVLSDVHNAFMPLLEGFLVTLSEAEALVDCLMEHIPRLFMNEPASEVILGPVIQVGLEALKNANCSGKLFVFHSSIPNADAPGKLAHRDGQKLLGTDKQKTVLSPQDDFYSKLAQECVAAGCAVDLFLFPNAYIDIASISPLCRHTGGQIYKYSYFQSHTDGDRFLEDLERNVANPTAFDAVLRLRTSAGISPVFYYGNFFMSNTTDVELSAIDCHKSVTIELAYDDKLPENENVYVQAALLYTTITGERKIRVHNLALLTAVGMPDIFRCCELDTIINFLAKQALKQLLDHSPQQTRSSLVSRAVKILTCYRKHCATASQSAQLQLILPEALKLLPLFVNCLLKSDAVNGGSDMSLDDRSFAMLAVNSMDVKSTAAHFYPTLIPLHNIDSQSETMPAAIRCSIEKLNDSGAYLLENGIYMFLWIGQNISPNWLQDVFGVQSASQVDKQKSSLPDLDTPLSHRIRSIIDELEDGRQWYMKLTVMVQGDKLEVVFRQFLVEDRGTDGSASYIDFMCHLYKEISKNL